MWKERTNYANLIEIGQRLKEYRIRKNLKQKELAEHAGVSLDTVIRLERGESIGMDKFMRIMRSLGMIENFDLLVPTPPISPILLYKLAGKKRYRVRNKITDEI